MLGELELIAGRIITVAGELELITMGVNGLEETLRICASIRTGDGNGESDSIKRVLSRS